MTCFFCGDEDPAEKPAPNPRITLIREKLQEIHRQAVFGESYPNFQPSDGLSLMTTIRNRADEALMELADLEEDLEEVRVTTARREALRRNGWPEHITLPPHACCTESHCLCDCLTCAEARANEFDPEIVSFDAGDPYPDDWRIAVNGHAEPASRWSAGPRPRAASSRPVARPRKRPCGEQLW